MTERVRVRARRAPGLITAAGLVVLLGLGVWQLQRAAWKDGLIAERGARLALAVVPVSEASAEPTAWELRRVTVAGRFDHGRELTVLRPGSDGGSGYHVITPLLSSSGGAVLVDRGWVPFDRRDPASRAEGQVAGWVELEGIVRLADEPGPFAPDNDPGHGVWFSLDPSAMAAAMGLVAPPLVVEAVGPAPPGGLPQPAVAGIGLTNPHRGYALTWSSLAVALAVIYLVYRRRPRSGSV